MGLLNQAKEKHEKIIDTNHITVIGKRRKPRTYRKKARKQYLSLSKQRKPSKEKIHKAIKQQLGYVHRNLKHIEKLGINSLHRSEEHTSELQSRGHLVCRLLLEKKKKTNTITSIPTATK